MKFQNDLPDRFRAANANVFTASVDYPDGRPRQAAERAVIAGLIRTVFGPEAACGHNPDGSPFVKGWQGCPISVSHCNGRAALAVSCDGRPVGIDIETPREQLRRIASRFLSPPEAKRYASSDSLLLKAWTAKEATFKCALSPGLVVGKINVDLENNIASTPDGRRFRLFFMEGYRQMAALSSELSD
ncbi:MAG: 4'-phosphopantetheinyl transferase superfamily protein [Paramuribaculum sp.]|nr:4'-phosphopantetheinyl transferase superfamily protein [Paramuribaculum sp.]